MLNFGLFLQNLLHERNQFLAHCFLLCRTWMPVCSLACHRREIEAIHQLFFSGGVIFLYLVQNRFHGSQRLWFHHTARKKHDGGFRVVCCDGIHQLSEIPLVFLRIERRHFPRVVCSQVDEQHIGREF